MVVQDVLGACSNSLQDNSNYITVRPLLSAPLLSAELDYPRFLRPNPSTPNLYEIQSDLYYSHLYYPRFLRPKFSTPKYRGY